MIQRLKIHVFLIVKNIDLIHCFGDTFIKYIYESISMKKKINSNKKKATFDFFNEKLMDIVNKQQPVISNKIQEEQISTISTPTYEIEIKSLMQKYHPLDVFKSVLIAENFLD